MGVIPRERLLRRSKSSRWQGRSWTLQRALSLGTKFGWRKWLAGLAACWCCFLRLGGRGSSAAQQHSRRQTTSDGALALRWLRQAAGFYEAGSLNERQHAVFVAEWPRYGGTTAGWQVGRGEKGEGRLGKPEVQPFDSRPAAPSQPLTQRQLALVAVGQSCRKHTEATPVARLLRPCTHCAQVQSVSPWWASLRSVLRASPGVRAEPPAPLQRAALQRLRRQWPLPRGSSPTAWTADPASRRSGRPRPSCCLPGCPWSRSTPWERPRPSEPVANLLVAPLAAWATSVRRLCTP